jgi:hypothetical protein
VGRGVGLDRAELREVSDLVGVNGETLLMKKVAGMPCWAVISAKAITLDHPSSLVSTTGFGGSLASPIAASQNSPKVIAM